MNRFDFEVSGVEAMSRDDMQRTNGGGIVSSVAIWAAVVLLYCVVMHCWYTSK